MKRFRDPNWVLILIFLGLIAVAPAVQTILELSGDDGVVATEIFNDWPTAQHLRAYEHKMEEASWAKRMCRPWLQFAQFSLLKEGGEKIVFGSQGWYFFKPGLKYMLARPDPASIATNDVVGAIVDFRNQLAARGVQLLVMPVPNKDSIYPELLTARAASLRGVMAPRTREIMEKLRAHGIETLDLFQEFTEARQPGGANPESAPLYLAQDTHWSPAGVSIAAKAAARRLVELGWIQPGRADYRAKPAPVQRQGDILRMLQSPRIERSVPPENVAGVQVIRASDGQPYQDEPDAEILVLGDSFLRIYQTDIPNSAGFISHLAKELKQPLLSLVNDGGGSTLVREELSSRPIFLNKKKVVLYEFVERDIGIGVKGWRRVTLPPSSSGMPRPITGTPPPTQDSSVPGPA